MQTLRAIKAGYGVQCVMTEAVSGELRRKLQNKYPEKAGVLKKAVANSTIVVLSEAALSVAGYRSAPALIDQIEQLGREYAVRIDRGEAYTHAASNVLAVPALSQDLEAIWKFIEAGVHVQRPILRAFDVVIFGLRSGFLLKPTANMCERNSSETSKEYCSVSRTVPSWMACPRSINGCAMQTRTLLGLQHQSRSLISGFGYGAACAKRIDVMEGTTSTGLQLRADRYRYCGITRGDNPPGC